VPVETNLIGTPPRGYDLQGTSAQPEAVVITGPQRLIDQVDVVEADVNLTGARTNFQETLLVHARDGNGGDIEGVNIEPESVVVRAEILQVQFSAPFVVRPDISGTPAQGYNASSITVSPALVVVTGPAEAFSSIDAVQGLLTEPVSIEAATADVVRTVALRLPPGVTVDEPAVTVRVVIAPGRGSASFTVAVTPTNVPGGMTATLSPTTVEVVFVGAVPDLNAIDETAIVATVDLNGLEAGEHQLDVRVQAPPNVSVGSVQPSPITVTLRPS
jgi:YbbR domain-containing protein